MGCLSMNNGIPLGYPLSLIMANLFMGTLEHSALYWAPLKPLYFKKYVDDTFIVWPHGWEKLLGVFQFLEYLHDCLNFTMEVEVQGSYDFGTFWPTGSPMALSDIRFLRKPTHTNLYLNASSFHHPAHKKLVLSTFNLSSKSNLG